MQADDPDRSDGRPQPLPIADSEPVSIVVRRGSDPLDGEAGLPRPHEPPSPSFPLGRAFRPGPS